MRRLDTSEFIKKASAVHNVRYNYALVDYHNMRTKVSIICESHGKFLQSPHSHLKGRGCPKCANNEKLSIEEIIKRFISVHGNTYDYSNVSYHGLHTKVKIACSKHGIFEQTPANHYHSKCGCPRCTKAFGSKMSLEWFKSLNNINIIMEKRIDLINGTTTRVDGFDPTTKTVYEFHGDFWHGYPTKWYTLDDMHPFYKQSFKEVNKKSIDRDELIKSSGYNLITKIESNWKNENKSA